MRMDSASLGTIAPVPNVEESFESCRLVLDGARTEIQHVNLLIEAFLADDPCRLVIEPKPKKAILCAEIMKKPSPEIRRAVYRSVNDLRNALDQAVFGASAALGASPLEKAAFPFRQSPVDLDRAFTGKNGMCRDVPPELHALIKSFEPYPRGNGYPGGDDTLRHLGAVSNPNKHSIALRIQPTLRGPINIGVGAAPGSVRVIRPTWNSAKTKLALIEFVSSTDFQYNINVGADIVFAETVVDGESVTGFFKVQLPKVESIIAKLEAESRRILGARP